MLSFVLCTMPSHLCSPLSICDYFPTICSPLLFSCFSPFFHRYFACFTCFKLSLDFAKFFFPRFLLLFRPSVDQGWSFFSFRGVPLPSPSKSRKESRLEAIRPYKYESKSPNISPPSALADIHTKPFRQRQTLLPCSTTFPQHLLLSRTFPATRASPLRHNGFRPTSR